MLGHLDGTARGRLSVKELYQLEPMTTSDASSPSLTVRSWGYFLVCPRVVQMLRQVRAPLCRPAQSQQRGLLGGYIPECDSEGYYQPTQSHAGAGCDMNSQEVSSNHVDDDAEDGDGRDMDAVEGRPDMPLDI
ncbi:proteoglycan Cow-like [Penaeus monodon]|uniref:proteoglycan Cow-like n=1 Tax=Penaeus monodon TaxID=6687 RepID=UPI0018A7633A|nr:proteoglycan Cow-like [Penaeus monodon]